MSIRGSARLGVLFAVLPFCVALLLPPNAGATIHHPGKWTSDALDFNGTAVNMMIVPDGGAGNHSRIIWWADEHGDVYDTDG